MGLQPFRYDMQRGRAATLSSLSEIARFQEVPPVFGEALSSNFKYNFASKKTIPLLFLLPLAPLSTLIHISHTTIAPVNLLISINAWSVAR